jgi:hypothetical protein
MALYMSAGALPERIGAAHSVLAEGGSEILGRVAAFLAGDDEPGRRQRV